MWNAAKESAMRPEVKDFLLLPYDPSPWNEIVMSVTGEVSGAIY